MYLVDLMMCPSCGSSVPEWDMRRKKVGGVDTFQNPKMNLVCSLGDRSPVLYFWIRMLEGSLRSRFEHGR